MKIVLIDGNSLLFRAYYATAYGGGVMMKASDGTVTNAIYALSNIITKVMSEQKPDYALVAFDTDKPTFRHLKYKDYKAGRKETPPELVMQFPLARELVKDLGIFVYEKEGYEADDIIGTVSKLGEDNNLQVEIYSGDRDLLQLIGSNTTVNLTKKGVSDLKIMTVESLNEELGISPIQITDLKGLMGDASDNIPGIQGVGEKTALKLLKEYGTVEKVIEADISGKLGEKIKEQKQAALDSKDLATINRAMPLDFTLDDLKYNGQKEDELRAFYTRLDMHSLLKKMATPQVKIENVNYLIINEIPKSFYKDNLGLVLEINGDNYHKDEIVGLALSDGDLTYFIKTSDIKNDINLQRYLMSNTPKLGLDIKKIIVSLNRMGICANNFTFDLLLGAYLLQPSLKDEAFYLYDYFGIQVPYLSTIYNRGNYEIEKVAAYASMLAYHLVKIKEEVIKCLEEKNSLKLFNEIELPLASILAKMEMNGVKLDLDLLAKKSEVVAKKIEALSKEIYELAGEEYNIQSSQQTAAILFDKLQLPANKKRSTSADELSLLIDYHPIIRKILEYRQYYKLQSVYLQGLPTYLLDDGKIHTIYNQALTQTGRLSSRDPNLQNISVRTSEGKEVRKAFIAENSGWYILSFDYSQIELRVLAHMANAKSLIDAFNKGLDPHKETAMRIFNVGENEVTDIMRRQAKVVNFGIVYGMSDWGLAEELGIDVKTSKEFIRAYYDQYPEIKSYFDKVILDCMNNGYVKTMYDRVRYVPEIKDKNFNIREFGKRVAKNTPIQGTAADVMKIAMIKVDKILQEHNFKTKLLLQVHDELVFEVPYEELLDIIDLVGKALEDFNDFKVKLKADYHYGYSWLDE